MTNLKYQSTESIVRGFIKKGKEGECWDFKQEWHENMADLLKDIICFANTTHENDCYLIFGVSDDLKITGMIKPRKKQAEIIDAISHLVFAGDNYPKIEVKPIVIDNIEIDVLVVFNVENTPIYLKRTYGEMHKGCIYTRVGDKNTPNGGNAEITDIENLWRKRFKLMKSPLEYMFDCMSNKQNWTETEDGYYNKYHPEYTMKLKSDDEDLSNEFYSYAMTNEHTSYDILSLQYQNTVLDSYQIVVLDGGRLSIPIPSWGYLCHDKYGLHNKYVYKYYVYDSKRYRLLSFLYDSENSEQRFALMHLKDVVLFYDSDEERLGFEAYIEDNQEIVNERLKNTSRFNYIDTGNEIETANIKERLNFGIVLNSILKEWRESKEQTK